VPHEGENFQNKLYYILPQDIILLSVKVLAKNLDLIPIRAEDLSGEDNDLLSPPS
jgi:hypothetical protein